MWFVYICDRNGQLYTGISTDLDHRMRQHKARLLHTEAYDDKHEATKRDRQIKGWRREKELSLVNKIGAFNAHDALLRSPIAQQIDTAIPHDFLIHASFSDKQAYG